MSNPDECPKCSEGDTSRISRTAICVVCKQTKDAKEIFDGVCKDCLQQHLGYTLQTIRVCGKCGKEVKYRYTQQTSPCCNVNILTITRIFKTQDASKPDNLRPLKKWSDA
jgi:hypothetical protein